MGLWGKIKHIAHDAGKAVGDAGKSATGGVVAAWKTTSHEAFAVGTALESTGLDLSKGALVGGKIAEGWLEDGAEYTGKGLVAAGNYVTQHACDIAIGSALGSIWATATVDGEEETSIAGLVSICAADSLDSAALTSASKALAFLLAEPIWCIPGVSSAVGDEDLLRAVLAFAIFKCCKEEMDSVVSTGGQILAGVIIACVTSLVCEGKLPGGFEPWKKEHW